MREQTLPLDRAELRTMALRIEGLWTPGAQGSPGGVEVPQANWAGGTTSSPRRRAHVFFTAERRNVDRQLKKKKLRETH